MHSLLRIMATVALAAAFAACDARDRDDTAQRNQDEAIADRDDGGAFDRQSDSTQIAPGGDLGTSGAGTGGTEADQSFDHFAMMANHAEIELGRLAQRKAQNAEVKQFANQMVTDHTKAMQELQRITGMTAPQAQQGQAQPPQDQQTQARGQQQSAAPQQTQHLLGPMHQQTYDRLNGLSGTEFDREFMRVMVEEHQKAVARFQQEADTTARRTDRPTGTAGRTAESDNRLSQWARQTLPTLQQHLDKAQQIQSRIDQSRSR